MPTLRDELSWLENGLARSESQQANPGSLLRVAAHSWELMLEIADEADDLLESVEYAYWQARKASPAFQRFYKRYQSPWEFLKD